MPTPALLTLEPAKARDRRGGKRLEVALRSDVAHGKFGNSVGAANILACLDQRRLVARREHTRALAAAALRPSPARGRNSPP